jgi:hypothetical protein
MSVSHSSIRAYDALKASGFKGQHAAILSHMERGQIYSRRVLAKLAGLETSAVAGRTHELLEQGALVVAGEIRCPITGRLVDGLKLVEAQGELLA